MNWKLVLQLSMFGLATALGSVFVLPPNIETLCWPVIFIVVTILVARLAPGRYFLHGFFVGLTNWVWVSAAHIIFYDTYAARHPLEVAAMMSLPIPKLPALGVLIVDAFRSRSIPIPGASGVIIGLLSWLASRIPALNPRRLQER